MARFKRRLNPELTFDRYNFAWFTSDPSKMESARRAVEAAYRGDVKQYRYYLAKAIGKAAKMLPMRQMTRKLTPEEQLGHYLRRVDAHGRPLPGNPNISDEAAGQRVANNTTKSFLVKGLMADGTEAEETIGVGAVGVIRFKEIKKIEPIEVSNG